MTELDSERRLDPSQWIDRLAVRDALALLLESQNEAAVAVKAALPQIEAAVVAAHEKLSQAKTGRLIYSGAGTSARIAVQDGAELLPTFNWPEERIEFVIAGGTPALLRAIEGAEDDSQDAAAQIEGLHLTPSDIFIGIAASGHTAFTIGAIQAARKAGATTIGISNNPNTPLVEHAEYPILLHTGAEALAGSTRLKAGTAQKICLNLFSTEVMVMLGYVRNGLMSEMQPRNQKLRRRKAAIDAMLKDDG